MGATIREMIITASSEQAMLKKFKKIQDEDRIQYGTDPYSGSWANVDGIKRLWWPEQPKRLTKKQERITFEMLEVSVEKWECAKFVQFGKKYLISACVAT